MGFWIFMLITDLLIPVIMIVFGWYFMKKAPKKINMLFGYRTDRSMKNRDTWEFAHSFIGKLWLKWGLAMLLLTIASMIFTTGRNENIVGTVGLIVCTLQLILLVGSIFPTEKALKKTFDKDGNRI